MRKTIIAINQIIELNHILVEKDLKVKVHLHDACGSQSIKIETLNDTIDEESYNVIENEITQYFNDKNIQIKFLESKMEFVVVD